MREYNEAIQATVRLLALLETMMVNLQALSAMAGRGTHRKDECRKVADKITHFMTVVQRLNGNVRGWVLEEGANSQYLHGKHWRHANGIVALCRKIRRDAVGVARWFNIPTKMLTAMDMMSERLYMDSDNYHYEVADRYTWEDQAE